MLGTVSDGTALPANAAAGSSLVLIGPQLGPDYWHHVTSQPEWSDAKPHPIDRWSKRVLEALAKEFGGQAVFPSDGPPWPPFFSWATRSGRLWQSPVGMLVHQTHGLWVSFRGALLIPFTVSLAKHQRPCDSCASQPCLTACPVSALSATRYDTDACHGHLNAPNGTNCLEQGCAARRACPLTTAHARLPEHAAYHMSQFHK